MLLDSGPTTGRRELNLLILVQILLTGKEHKVHWAIFTCVMDDDTKKNFTETQRQPNSMHKPQEQVTKKKRGWCHFPACFAVILSRLKGNASDQ
jgi:hypothetical protein